MKFGKRFFDIVLAVVLCLILCIPLLILVALQRITNSGPVFFVSERMGQNLQPFQLIKLRTMAVGTSNEGVTGGDKKGNVTPLGRWLRRYRLDEIPQLINILAGDMSFVGPRPPIRKYTDKYPETYARVLANRPGVTGLASLVYHAHEERLLKRCKTAAETDATYGRACVPRKAHLDLIWQENQSIWFDLWIIFQTGAAMLPFSSARQRWR